MRRVDRMLTDDWLTAPATQAVFAMLDDAGHRALAVGGCVRNALIGAPVSDIDIATDAPPDRVIELGEAAGLRAIPTGILHGTVTVISAGVAHEITTFRRDVDTDGRHATVAFSTDVAEDAARRDFTMNALYAQADGTVVDPLDGLPDLRARHVRFIGDPAARILEDYLRILRFFRFTAWYGDPALGLDAEGLAACAACIDGLDRISAERIGAETCKLLAAPDPAPVVAAMARSGILARILPGADATALPLFVHSAPRAGLDRAAGAARGRPQRAAAVERRCEGAGDHLGGGPGGPSTLRARGSARRSGIRCAARPRRPARPSRRAIGAGRGAPRSRADVPPRRRRPDARPEGSGAGGGARPRACPVARPEGRGSARRAAGRRTERIAAPDGFRRSADYTPTGKPRAHRMFRYFENLIDPYAPHGGNDVPPARLWPFMVEYSRPFTRVFGATAVVAVLVAVVEIWLIYYMGRLVDILSDSTPATFLSEHGVELALVALFILFLRPALQALSTLLLNQSILPNYGTLMRWRAHNHVLRQSVGWFENDFAGRIANRIMQAPPAAGEAVFQVFDAIAFALAYLIGAAVLLWIGDPRLVVPLLGWFVLYGILVRWTVARVGPASKAASDARSMTTGRVVDAYTNIHSVKLFAHEGRELEYARDAIEQTRTTFQREMRIYSIMDVALVTLNGLLIVGVVGWGIWLWVSGTSSVGVVAAATALVLRLNAMTGWIMWALTSFFRSLGVVEEGMETIAQPIHLTDDKSAGPLALTDGAIAFDAVTHHYGGGKGGVTDLTLHIRPGEKVGLIGRSGAGKSTLVKLLLRFYDPERGSISIDGQDIAGVTQDSLRHAIGMVQQDSSLLHRSVADNIRYGRADATDAQVETAARKAQAHGFILDLVDPEGRTGYDAQVGERGVKLSGGQRQRIALARVILKDAPVLVLDEATSALDSEVEAAIQDTLYGMMEGKTVIAIAHRLSTIAAMDRILVIDDGAIIEEATHDELLAQGGLYASFWARQSGGFIRTEAAE